MKLTLNGTDWSNLWHINYLGGCGGETLATWTSKYHNIDVYQYKDTTPGSGFRDSFRDTILFQNKWPKDYPESFNERMDNILPNVLERKVKILSHMSYLWGSNLHTSEHYTSFDDFLTQIRDLDWEDIIYNWTLTKKQMLVSHLCPQDFSKFTIFKNSNLIRIFPTNENIKPFFVVLLLLKRLMLEDEVQAEYVQYLDSDQLECLHNVKSKQDGKVYLWQQELIRNQHFVTWDMYVERLVKEKFNFINFNNDYLLPSEEWVFGSLSVDSKNKIEKNLQISLSEFPLEEFQYKNRDIIMSNGFTFDMSIDKVISQLQQYYSKHNLPVVTDLKTIN